MSDQNRKTTISSSLLLR